MVQQARLELGSSNKTVEDVDEEESHLSLADESVLEYDCHWSPRVDEKLVSLNASVAMNLQDDWPLEDIVEYSVV